MERRALPAEQLRDALPNDLLADRVILVTGAGSGIGAAVASAAAAHGAQVLLLGRQVPPLETVYDGILDAGGARPSIVPFDLSRIEEPAFEELANLVDAECGRLDGLVHCAGNLDRLSPVEHWRFTDWHQIIQVHLNAAFALTRAMMPLLREAPDASTVFTSSDTAKRPRAHWGAYAVAKSAVETLATVLADECDPARSTRIHCIDPGPVRTALRLKAFPAEDRDALPTPADVAWAYLHLLGPDAAALHGVCVELA
jgi:NAD(P)-dependent dehydrogenase (short-subunit alcohol dehydrogenase family)